MKVLIVSTSDISGGAARAAYRLHHALLDAKVDSHMLVQSKSSDDITVIARSSESKVQKGLAWLGPRLDSLSVRFYRNRSQTLFSPSYLPSLGLASKINALNPDVVHLHWINGGMLSIDELSKIKAPIVWSLHDMWPFTGGCHYDENCKGYKRNCGSCPVLGSNKESDLSRRVHNRKVAAFNKIDNLTVIGLSNWLADCARKSHLFRERRVLTIPNPINTQKFSPFNKSFARDLLNVPRDKKLIVFGAMAATSDSRKGFKQLTEALLSLKSDAELLVFGSSEPQTPQGFNQAVHYLGYLHDDITLRALYSAADVMVVPSLQENLSNAIMEALACGTPVVGFDIGGNSDLIEHKKNGYLADPFETKDLANGIDWVLHAGNYKQLCVQAREKVLTDFDASIVVKQYLDLYGDVL